jgi:ligand-binding SRPBCC domain-containing protein
MQLHLKTNVAQNYLNVFNAFDEKLFHKLSPPFPKMKLVRFDGSKPGNMVEVILDAGVKSFRWTSLITDRKITDTEAFFIDEGQQLPPPLSKWHHKHLVSKRGNGATIHDIITYSSGNKLLDVLLYPVMALQFGMRKPIYQKLFGRA